MTYMLLIIEPRGQRATRTIEEGRAAYQKMLDWGADLKRRGRFIASESLLPDAHGVRVQVRAGRQSLVDGPFTEAKEMVGGFFLIDCATRGEALALAAECPAAAWATVEVREAAPCHVA